MAATARRPSSACGARSACLSWRAFTRPSPCNSASSPTRISRPDASIRISSRDSPPAPNETRSLEAAWLCATLGLSRQLLTRPLQLLPYAAAAVDPARLVGTDPASPGNSPRAGVGAVQPVCAGLPLNGMVKKLQANRGGGKLGL